MCEREQAPAPSNSWDELLRREPHLPGTPVGAVVWRVLQRIARRARGARG